MKNEGRGGGGVCGGVIAVKMAIRDCYKSTHMGEMLKEKGKKKKKK
jgi:hypothetical protein